LSLPGHSLAIIGGQVRDISPEHRAVGHPLGEEKPRSVFIFFRILYAVDVSGEHWPDDVSLSDYQGRWT
jgi:hypothetical protein